MDVWTIAKGKGKGQWGRGEKTGTTPALCLLALPYWLFPHPRPHIHTPVRIYYLINIICRTFVCVPAETR